MEALYLIVQLAGERVLLPAATVESVVEIDTVTPVPRVAGHVAGLAALRSRVLTIIDCRNSLTLGKTVLGAAMCTVIVTIDAHQYGLLVDEVADVVPIAGGLRPLNLALSSAWARVATAMVEHEGAALLVIDPALIVAGPAIAEAA